VKGGKEGEKKIKKLRERKTAEWPEEENKPSFFFEHELK